jgi:hypothetical protein
MPTPPEEMTVTNLRSWMKTAHRLVFDAARTATKVKQLLHQAVFQIQKADELDQLMTEEEGVQTPELNEEHRVMRLAALQAIIHADKLASNYAAAKMKASVDMEIRAEELYKKLKKPDGKPVEEPPPFPAYDPHFHTIPPFPQLPNEDNQPLLGDYGHPAPRG